MGEETEGRRGPSWRAWVLSILVAVALSVTATLLLGGSVAFRPEQAAASGAAGAGAGILLPARDCGEMNGLRTSNCYCYGNIGFAVEVERFAVHHDGGKPERGKGPRDMRMNADTRRSSRSAWKWFCCFLPVVAVVYVPGSLPAGNPSVP